MKLIGDKYNDYKNRVLAKTDGTNVHEVNGLLGIVVNGSLSVDWFEKQINRQIDLDKAQRAVDESIRKIAILTHIHP